MSFAARLLALALLLLVAIAAGFNRQVVAAGIDTTDRSAHARELSRDPAIESGSMSTRRSAMSSSTLTPENLPAGPDRSIHKGHGTAALGPSDSSDSGSDLQGATGPEIGDAELDGDTDRQGTGERAAAGRDKSPRDGADIDVDHIEQMPDPDD